MISLHTAIGTVVFYHLSIGLHRVVLAYLLFGVDNMVSPMIAFIRAAGS